MAYPQYFGQTDKVHNTGLLIYGGDGTHAYPIATDSTGRLLQPVLKRVSVTKVLSANGAYAIGDVLSESHTNTVGTAWTFSAIARANGGYGYIVKAQVLSETTNLTPRLTLFLYNATPTCELDDNAGNNGVLNADLSKYVGKIDFPAMDELGGDSESLATPSTVGNLPLAFECASGSSSLVGVLVTRDAFTQGVLDDMTVILTAEQY